MTVQEAKAFAKASLTSSPSPLLDAEVLLMEVTSLSKTQLLFERDRILSEKEENLFKSFIEKRKTGLPVAYITCHKEFYGYDFFVTQDVLIPKPDTELLVEKALETIEEKLAVNQKKILTVCDMCTGSGCVGLSIIRQVKDRNLTCEENMICLVMADISGKALEVAKKNADKLVPDLIQKGCIHFIRTNLFELAQGSYDIIVSNPPYVPKKEALELLRDGRNEPLLALDGDVLPNGENSFSDDGLEIMRNLVPQAKENLTEGGVLLAESGEYNAEETKKIFEKAGLKNTEIFKDLEGQLRVTKGIKKGILEN